ncbi:MAG: glutaminase [Bacteroidetes bacterium]|nr:MAG: glutaminase [Bacteroidota bacterium]
MDYVNILKDIEDEIQPLNNEGTSATYIPELAKIDPNQCGMSLLTMNGETHSIGASQTRFSIQSISKVFTLSMAFSLLDETLWERVGVEPSGNSFNSIVALEYEKGIPRNPFINAGALVVADILITHLDDAKTTFLEYVKELTGSADISYNETIVKSEKAHGHLNAALINMMKAHGNINNPAQTVLDFYYHQCSLELSCEELAKAFLHFAESSHEFSCLSFKLTGSQLKRINGVMITNGFYDESGEFAFKVGLPGKSGVGGGIVAVKPREFSVAVWSPRLNEKGNSVCGMKALELLTTKTGISVF